jgi:hypothetical protein
MVGVRFAKVEKFILNSARSIWRFPDLQDNMCQLLMSQLFHQD